MAGATSGAYRTLLHGRVSWVPEMNILGSFLALTRRRDEQKESF